jgi:hypothetical protein
MSVSQQPLIAAAGLFWHQHLRDGMALTPLQQLSAAAETMQDPSLTAKGIPNLGGVDPLGLRQLNFDLMDRVFPGLNNVARHIRPFVLVTWAWRRAAQVAKRSGDAMVEFDLLQDFVDRIEVVYVVSQLLGDRAADLPGGQYLSPLLGEPVISFSGGEWQRRREARRYSTALSAPINYGPGLKMLGWLQTHPELRSVLCPRPEVEPALDAFEAQLAPMLTDDVFCRLGEVSLSRDAAAGWFGNWRWNTPTAVEAQVMRRLLFGHAAPVARQNGGELMRRAARHTESRDFEAVRAAMAGAPSAFEPPASLRETQSAWRLTQARQLFRLTLESAFYWILQRLHQVPVGMDVLVREFIAHAPLAANHATSRQWVEERATMAAGPTGPLTRLRRALEAENVNDLVPHIVDGLAFCLAKVPEAQDRVEREDRLPLRRAQREFLERAHGSIVDFVRHVLEAWVLAQHTYWAVGRGLGDARVGERVLLRLKVALEEEGWTALPGAGSAAAPRPTPDRLHTAMSLAQECGYLE